MSTESERVNRILRNVDITGLGLELGPSHRPVAPKSKGYNIKVLDHATQQELKEKYKDHNVELGNIEEVDYVWSGGTYTDLIGDVECFDYIIASHVIEHVPDFIGFLIDCEKLLKPAGVLSLVVPDKRFCFDQFRQNSPISQVIDRHLTPQTIHTPGSVVDYFLNVSFRDNLPGWHEGFKGKDSLAHSLQDAVQHYHLVKDNNAYLDIHAWCFTPSHFRLLINDLADLGFCRLREVEFIPTSGHEFYVSLSKTALPIQISRLELLKMNRSEEANQLGLAP